MTWMSNCVPHETTEVTIYPGLSKKSPWSLFVNCMDPNPADALRNNDVVSTSKRRHFDVVTTLLLYHVFGGNCVESYSLFKELMNIGSVWLQYRHVLWRKRVTCVTQIMQICVLNHVGNTYVQTYCTAWYGCQTWQRGTTATVSMETKWRKYIQRTMGLSPRTRSILFPGLAGSLSLSSTPEAWTPGVDTMVTSMKSSSAIHPR